MSREELLPPLHVFRFHISFKQVAPTSGPKDICSGAFSCAASSTAPISAGDRSTRSAQVCVFENHRAQPRARTGLVAR